MDRRTLTKHLFTLATFGAIVDWFAATGASAQASQTDTQGQIKKDGKFRIRVLVYDGADEVDFTAPIEVFGYVASQRSDVDVALASLEPKASVTGAFGLKVIPDGVYDTPPNLLVVPGGGWVSHSPRGVRAEIARGKILDIIRAAHAGGSIIASACTGAMALAATGLLDGKLATTHNGALADLRRTKAKVVQARVVDDGNILTGGGVTSTFDLALWITERFWGHELAARASAYLEYPLPTDVYRG
jgi:transcriptional regulator GlxA family with amidase domain